MQRASLWLQLCVGLVITGSAVAEDWHRWRGPNLDGISNERDWVAVWPPSGPRRLWKANVGTGFSSVSVSDGRLFTMGNREDVDTVHCLDAATGEELWKFEYEEPLHPKYYEGGTSATPTVDGDRVYTLSKSGDLHCLAKEDGRVLWSRDLAAELGVKPPTWGIAGSVLIDGDLAVLNVGDKGTAFNKMTGEAVWTSGKGPSGYSTPVPFRSGSSRAVILMGEKKVFGIRLSDGEELWSYPWKTRHGVNAADPVLDGGRVFVSAAYGHGCALLQVAGQKPSVIWENKTVRSHFATAVLWQDHYYGVDESRLACVEAGTGKLKWKERALGKGSLMIADGKIIALSDKGELFVIEPSPASFKTISRAQVIGGKCWTVPVLSNGLIYCRNAKGDLVCLDVRGE